MLTKKSNGPMLEDFATFAGQSLTKWIEDNKLKWIEAKNEMQSTEKPIYSTIDDESCEFHVMSILGLFDDRSCIDVKASYSANYGETSNTRTVIWMYSIAECFDNNPHLWPALRMLLEWAMTDQVTRSVGSSHFIMEIFEFILLFIEVALGSSLRITKLRTPITIDRLVNWIESSTDGQKCVDMIVKFLKYSDDKQNHDHIVSRINPVSNQKLVISQKLEEFQQICEFACFKIAENDGNVLKLLKLPTKTRKVKIDRRFLHAAMTKAELRSNKKLILGVRKKADLKSYQSVDLDLSFKGQMFYMLITSSDYDAISQVEKALQEIQATEIIARRITMIQYSNHVENASVIIPEFSRGPHTRVTFSPITCVNFHLHHAEMTTAVMRIDSNDLNVDWKVTEYARFKDKFLQQIEEYQKLMSDDAIKIKETSQWRLFGEMKCMVRIGCHYFIQLADSLINSSESMSLGKVEETIATLATPSSAENARLKRTTLMKSTQALSVQEANQSYGSIMSSIFEIDDLRNTFYGMTTTSKEKIELFAQQNGFTPSEPSPTGVSISASWKQYNLSVGNFKIYTDNCGVPQNINHQKTRWMSATFKQFDETELGDVRVYLETSQEAVEDEKRLDTLPEYIKKESILHPDLVKLIKQVDFDDADFPSDPLIGSMKNRGWKFTLLRINTCKAMLRNDHGDVLKFNEIRRGNFDADGKFKYLDKHNELEVEMNMENRSNEEVCRDSYDMSMKLFEFIKGQKNE